MTEPIDAGGRLLPQELFISDRGEMNTTFSKSPNMQNDPNTKVAACSKVSVQAELDSQ